MQTQGPGVNTPVLESKPLFKTTHRTFKREGNVLDSAGLGGGMGGTRGSLKSCCKLSDHFAHDYR